MVTWTFEQLQNRVLRWLDEAGDTSTTRELVKDALNASHRRVLGSQRWPWMFHAREESINTVAGKRIYALHPALGQLSHLWDVQGRQFVPVVPRRQWESIGVDRAADANQAFGVSYGPLWPIKFQPNDATITAVSSDVGDTSAFVIQGTNTLDETVTETVTCTGTTPVISSTVWRTVTRVTVTGIPTGTRTLTSGADTLLSLTPSQVGKLYPTVEFVEYPAEGREFTYQFRQDIPTLTLDNDIPFIHPTSAAEILAYDSLLDMTTYNTELGDTHVRLWKKRYDELWKSLVETNEESGIASVPRTVRDLDATMPRRFLNAV